MKIKFIPFLLILVIIGCGQDDNTAGTYIGTWIGTNIEITRCDDFTDEDFRTIRCTETSCYRLIFNDDGTYSFQQGIATEFGTWTADGVNITLCIEEDGEEICTTTTGVLSSTLRLSYPAEQNGCVTAFIFERMEETDDGMTN